MKLTRSISALVLACALAGSVLAGCASSGSSSSSGAQSSAGATTSNAAYYTDESGNPVPLDNIVTVNGEPIPLAEFRYYFLSRKNNYQMQLGGDEAVWKDNQELIATIRLDSLDDILFDRCMRQFAADNGFTFTDEDQKLVDDQYNEAVTQQGGEEKFAAALEAAYMTADVYRYMLESQVIQMKLQTEIQNTAGKFAVPDEDARKYFEEYYLRAKHILVKTAEITDEAELKKKEEAANKALERAKAGEDFDALIKEYGEDPGMEANPNGYYFVEGDMVAEFYEGTKALKDNEISGLVKSDYGYHIIQRLPLEDSYFQENKAPMLGNLAADNINTKIRAMMDSAKVEKAPEFEKLNGTNLK